MKSVLTSIQPYYVFLIIAHLMGWNIPQEKTVEVRKNFPKDLDWDKVAYIYCSKNRKSFNLIPKEYQPLMEKFLGKVIGEFVCDRIDKYCGRLTTFAETPYKNKYVSPEELAKTCLSIYEINDYLNGKNSYFWHISDLKIYDTPKELWEFKYPCPVKFANYDCSWGFEECKYKVPDRVPYECDAGLTRPPQSWCYVEELYEKIDRKARRRCLIYSGQV